MKPAEWLRFYIPEMEAIFDKMRIGAESSGTTVRSHVAESARAHN